MSFLKEKLQSLKQKINPFKFMSDKNDSSSKKKDKTTNQKFNINTIFNAENSIDFQISNQLNNQNEHQQQASKMQEELNKQIINIDNIRTLSWNGIPIQIRKQSISLANFIRILAYKQGLAQKNLIIKQMHLSYNSNSGNQLLFEDIDKFMANSNFSEEELKVIKIIGYDVKRTAPDIEIFQLPIVKDIMVRILVIWHFRHPASGYVQGINDIVMLLLNVFFLDFYLNSNNYQLSEIMPKQVLNPSQLQLIDNSSFLQIETDTYFCLCRITDKIQDFYTMDHPGIKELIFNMKAYLTTICPQLLKHFSKFDIDLYHFMFKWIHCLLIREFQMPLVYRLFDTYLSEDKNLITLHQFICIAILLKHQNQLLKLEYSELIIFLQALPTKQWQIEQLEIIIAEAYSKGLINSQFQSTNVQ